MVERYATMRLRSNPEGYRRSLLEVGRRSHYPDPSSLTCPVLLVTGDHDPLLDVADVEQLAAALPKARLEVFENCGHVSKIEHPDRLNQVLLEFLSQEAPAIRPAPPQRASA
jgi:pimeloyl-ACP methyl ester carboxylesterase